MTWQPIATVPQDGSDILVYAQSWNGYEVVSWDEDAPPKFPWATHDGPNYNAGLFTHWMPLPAPPCSTDDRGAE